APSIPAPIRSRPAGRSSRPTTRARARSASRRTGRCRRPSYASSSRRGWRSGDPAARDDAGMKAFVAGIALGLVFVLLVHSVEPQPARQMIALFLAFTACVYAGALLAQTVPPQFLFLELAVAAIVFALSVVGLRASTTALAAGYALHGAWDLLHHPRAVPTPVGGWFPPACAAFASVVARAPLIGPWRPVA